MGTSCERDRPVDSATHLELYREESHAIDTPPPYHTAWVPDDSSWYGRRGGEAERTQTVP